MGVQERRVPSGGEPAGVVGGWRPARREGEQRVEEEGAGVPADGGGGVVVRLPGADSERARVGEVLRRRPRPLPVPQALLHRPHLPPQRLLQVQLHLHVRHRHQESQCLPRQRYVRRKMSSSVISITM